jgi:hypothetical protein
MEKEDQIIKELIKEGFLKSAPDDFTENVMQAVAKTNESKSVVRDFPNMVYALVIIISMITTVGIIAYYKPSFFQKTLSFFGNFKIEVFSSFSGLYSDSLNWGSGFQLNSMILGVILIMAALLAFDKLLGRKRKVMNVFV